MNRSDLIAALRRGMVETGSLICLGCGHEYHCSVSGCAVMREAAELLETDGEEIARLWSRLAAMPEVQP